MSKFILGQQNGDFKARVLTDDADMENPAFEDILFDSDRPSFRIFETGFVDLNWGTGKEFSENSGLTTINTVDRGFIPVCLATVFRPGASAYRLRTYNTFGGGTWGSGARQIWGHYATPYCALAMAPARYDDGVANELYGFRLRLYSNQIQVNNYFRSGGPFPYFQTTFCDPLLGGYCSTTSWPYDGDNPHPSYSNPKMKLTYHLLEML